MLSRIKLLFWENQEVTEDFHKGNDDFEDECVPETEETEEESQQSQITNTTEENIIPETIIID